MIWIEADEARPRRYNAACDQCGWSSMPEADVAAARAWKAEHDCPVDHAERMRRLIAEAELVAQRKNPPVPARLHLQLQEVAS